MKTSLILLALSFIPFFASADSFNCDSAPLDHLHVLIRDTIDASSGTRTAAILLVTDTTAPFGERTRIASKNSVQNGAFWNVDTSSYAGGVTGQLVGQFDRTKLSQIQVYIPTFDFTSGVEDGSRYEGYLLLYQAGDTSEPVQNIDLTCTYATKN